MNILSLISTILFAITANDLLAGPYTADIEPYGVVSTGDFFFPYLPSVVAAGVVTLYLGLKGWLNIPRSLARSCCARGFKALDSQGHTFWIIDKAVAFLLWVIALFPFILFPLAFVYIERINDIAISGALEGALLAFGIIAVISDKGLKEVQKTLHINR